MWLVQIFLPLEADTGGAFCNVKEELTKRFGGLTAYNRAPAEGLWRNGNKKEKDEIVIVEVMTDELDHEWWRDFRKRLERRLHQDELVVRAQQLERL